jgi:hypothetical protein
VTSRRDALASGLDADQPDRLVIDEGIENTDRVAPATYARDDDVRETTHLIEHLTTGFAADDRLKFTNHQRIGMRTERRSKQVVRVADVGNPIAHGLVDCILQRLAARIDLPDRGAEQLHPYDVERLATHVFGTHVDMALETEQRTRCRRGYAVLTGTRFGDDPGLPHPLRKQRLPEGVVDLVRTGVSQVFALEQDTYVVSAFGRTKSCLSRETPRLVERRRPTDVVPQQIR